MENGALPQAAAKAALPPALAAAAADFGPAAAAIIYAVVFAIIMWYSLVYKTSFFVKLVMVAVIVAPIAYFATNPPAVGSMTGTIAFAAVVCAMLYAAFLVFDLFTSISAISYYVYFALYGAAAAFAALFIVAFCYEFFRYSKVKINANDGVNVFVFFMKLMYFIINFLPCIIGEIVTMASSPTDTINKYVNRAENMPAGGITKDLMFQAIIAEVIIFLAILYFPRLMAAAARGGGRQIINEPMYLNEQITVASAVDVIPKTVAGGAPPTDKNWSPAKYINNYSVTFWLFMNDHTPSDGAYMAKANIFRLGQTGDTARGKPMLSYYYDNTDNNIAKYRVYFSNSAGGTAQFFDLEGIPAGQWNNWVFTYTNKLDVFVNGKLVGSKSFTAESAPTFADSDSFIVGQTAGLDGAICNMKYFAHPLSLQEVLTEYRLMAGMNPPVMDIQK